MKFSRDPGGFRLYLSLPLWERGLKYLYRIQANILIGSLPLWERGLKFVSDPLLLAGQDLSLPLWERGLKSPAGRTTDTSPLSLPLWERGLKFFRTVSTRQNLSSLPLWERGLKSGTLPEASRPGPTSLPLWERGLKLVYSSLLLILSPVAPLVGAWIEICLCWMS